MKKVILGFLFIAISYVPCTAQWANYYKSNSEGTWPGIRTFRQTHDKGFIIAGTFFRIRETLFDAIILKTNSLGTIEWQFYFGGKSNQDCFNCVVQTLDGGYIVGGYIEGAIILKLNWQGKIEWQQYYSQFSGGEITSIWEMADGGYIAQYGSSILRLNYNGDIIWNRMLGLDIIKPTKDGGFIGTTSAWKDGQRDIRVKKLASNGDVEWEYLYCGQQAEEPRDILPIQDKGYLVLAETLNIERPEYDLLIFKLKHNGIIEWQKIYDGSQLERAHNVIQIAGGRCLVSCTIDHMFSVLTLFSNGNLDETIAYNNATGFGLLHKTLDNGYVAGCIMRSLMEGFLIMKLLSDLKISPDCDYIVRPHVKVTDANLIQELSSSEPESWYIESFPSKISPKELDLTASTFCKAEYTTNLDVSCSVGGRTEPYPGSYIYYGGKEISIKAIPYPDNRFDSWTGDVPTGQGSNKKISLTMDTNKSLQAKFIVPKPKRPRKLRAEAISSYKIRLTWKDESRNENGFSVERRIKGVTKWIEVKQLKRNKDSYQDRRLDTTTVYQYRVRAFNESGYSSYSNKVSVQTK